MKFVTIPGNGDFELNGDAVGANGVETTRVSASVYKLGTGTVVVGYKNSSGTFTAFSEGTMVMDDLLVNHGVGVLLMVNVSGYADPLVIGYAG